MGLALRLAVAGAWLGMLPWSGAVTLTGVSVEGTGHVPGILVTGSTQLVVTCTYSDGSKTNCGDEASGYTTSDASVATVSASGLVTGLKQGAVHVTATVGSITSPTLYLTVIPMPSGTYTVTITGPSGSVATGTMVVK